MRSNSCIALAGAVLIGCSSVQLTSDQIAVQSDAIQKAQAASTVYVVCVRSAAIENKGRYASNLDAATASEDYCKEKLNEYREQKERYFHVSTNDYKEQAMREVKDLKALARGLALIATSEKIAQ